jgi:hypothetical protein
MARLSSQRIREYFEIGDNAETTYEQGRALEDLVCYVFERVPGIEVAKRNILNTFETEEIDVAFWNNRQDNGFHFLPNVLLVECKNWSRPIGSQEVGYYVQRIQNRGRDHGILVAANGITGSDDDRDRAHYEIAMALGRGIHILLLTREELINLSDTSELVKLMKEKLCELAVSGTVFT